ncbi:MAG: hypothetical protein ACLR6J_00350 [Parabacteroides merdae]
MDEEIFRAAVRHIFRNQGFTYESMQHPKIRALVDATTDIFAGAISPALESGVIPKAMAIAPEGGCLRLQWLQNLPRAA